jgi:hypothetical protein
MSTLPRAAGQQQMRRLRANRLPTRPNVVARLEAKPDHRGVANDEGHVAP